MEHSHETDAISQCNETKVIVDRLTLLYTDPVALNNGERSDDVKARSGFITKSWIIFLR